jgi:hypothetical protein
MIAGLAPLIAVLTMTTGKAISGIFSIPMVDSDETPKNTSAAVQMSAVTGRLSEMDVIFIRNPLPFVWKNLHSDHSLRQMFRSGFLLFLDIELEYVVAAIPLLKIPIPPAMFKQQRDRQAERGGFRER